MALSLNRINNAGVSDILDFSSKSSSSSPPPKEGDETSTNSAEDTNHDTTTIASTNGSIQNPPHQTHRSNHINNSNSNHGNNNSKTMFDVSRPRESSASQSLTSRNKRKNFKPRNICIYDEDEEENHYSGHSPDKVGNSDFALSESEIDDEDDNHRHSNGIFSNQSQPLDLSQGDVRGDSSSTNSTPEPVASNATVPTVQHQSISSFRSSDDKGSSCSDDTSVPIVSTNVSTPTTKKTTITTSSSSSPSIPLTGFSSSSSPPSSLPLIGSGDDVRTPLGFWRPGVISGIAPWIDPSFLTGSGALASKLEALQRSGSVDYTRYVKRFGSAAECGSAVCRELNYREHFHCLDCNSRVFVKKEEMIRHFKWHKKRDESLQHGFMRYSPCDDCSDKFPNCAHNRKQTHYHCLKLGCEKTYISTSDVQMHANYHRKDTAIIQEGFQRFRATEDCLTPSCPFQGQKTTHFHCRRSNCGFTFKNKADMEKHKSFHIRDEQLTRDGFKKFTKHEPCPFDDCRFSRVCNHIHCIRAGCNHVFHSSGQLYSHKRKHEKSESDVDASPAESQSQSSFADQQASSSLHQQQSQSQSSSSVTPAISSQPLSSLSTLPANLSQGPITETYPTGTTLTSIDGLPVFKRKRGRPPKNQVVEVPPSVTSSAPSQSLRHSLPPRTTSSSSLTSSSPSSSTTPGTLPPHHPFLSPSLPPEATALFNHPAFNLPLGLSPFGLAAAMSSNPNFAAAMTGSSSSTSMDGLIPVPMLPLLQLFNLPNPVSAAAYGLHPQLSSQLSPPQTSSSSSVSLSMPSQQNRTESASPQDDTSSEGSEAKKIRPNSGQQSGTSTPRPVVKDEPVPDGYMRYRFNEDCGYSYCGYREHQTHFHCMRKACGYSFCDKTRFVQHTARHERLDTLMGDEFQQFRSNVNCGYFGCPHSPANNSGQPASPANKASHFHCLKCDFVCTDTNRVVAHRRQHHKMDSINAAGFEKYTPSQDCGVESCIHVRRQTHYHCLQCQYAVLGLSQMSSHKYKHAQE